MLQRPEGPLHVSQNRIVGADGGGYGELVVVTDMSFVERRSTDTKKYVLYLFAAIATGVARVPAVSGEISWRGGATSGQGGGEEAHPAVLPGGGDSGFPRVAAHPPRPAGAGARPRIGAAHARRVADEL